MPVSHGVPRNHWVGAYQSDSSDSTRSSPSSQGPVNSPASSLSRSTSGLCPHLRPRVAVARRPMVSNRGARRREHPMGGDQGVDGGSLASAIAAAVEPSASASVVRINGAIIVRCPAGDRCAARCREKTEASYSNRLHRSQAGCAVAARCAGTHCWRRDSLGCRAAIYGQQQSQPPQPPQAGTSICLQTIRRTVTGTSSV